MRWPGNVKIVKTAFSISIICEINKREEKERSENRKSLTMLKIWKISVFKTRCASPISPDNVLSRIWRLGQVDLSGLVR